MAGECFVPRSITAGGDMITTGSTFVATGSTLTPSHRIIFLDDTGTPIYVPGWHLNG
jgi:hypothetical protein